MVQLRAHYDLSCLNGLLKLVDNDFCDDVCGYTFVGFWSFEQLLGWGSRLGDIH